MVEMGLWLSATLSSGDVMAYFAEIDDTNTVIQVLVIEDKVLEKKQILNTGEIITEDSQKGVDFLNDMFPDSGTWIQSTKGTRGGVHYGSDGEPDGGKVLRYNTANIGGTYDPTADAFYSPNPYPSWSLDENFIWQPPTPMPEDDKAYDWNEETQEWDEV